MLLTRRRHFSATPFVSALSGTIQGIDAMSRLVSVVAATVALVAVVIVGSSNRAWSAGKTHTYYIAAEETRWDYAPAGRDLMMGHDFGPAANVFVKRGADRVGSTYKKVHYVEYTDGTFTKRKPRPPNARYLGILGPIIHAEVGDKICIVFHNKVSRPFSIHPHGVCS